MTTSLYIFDCDGTLVDTERLHTRLKTEMITELGLNLSDDEIAEHLLGHRISAMFSNLEKSHGLKTPANIHASYKDRYKRELQGHDITIPHARETVLKLAESTKVCVASNGMHATVVDYLTKAGLMPPLLNSQIFSAVDLGVYKPAPDLFLHAMQQMGEANPDTVAVIEDSHVGVRASLAAGMRTIWFRPDNSNDALSAEFAGRVTVIKSLAELVA